MKKQILIFVLLLISTLIYSQTKIDSLVEIGIQYHDDGQFDEAIEIYKTALDIDPNSALVNYEMAMTYMYAKDYEKSMKHSDKVIELNDKLLLPAYIAKGSCLDYLGKSKKSIKLFKKAIKEFGNHYLLSYNLGYNYYNLGEYDKAEQTLIKGINNNPNHASSHLLLGYVMDEQNKKVQSLLSLHYFLFIEANSERAKTAHNVLQNQFKGNVEQDENEPDRINIFVDENESESEFGAANMMISMLEATKTLEENEDKSEEEMFIENTTSFFKVLGELKEEKNTGLWWDFYVPFFYDIAKSEHMDTYCYYISQSSNSTASNWLKNNSEKIADFNTWLKER